MPTPCPFGLPYDQRTGLRVIYAFLFEDGSSVADADPADRKTLRVYQEGYRQGNELFARLAGLEYDSSCKNPERISGTAYDPDAYYNPDAVAIRIEQPLQMPDGGDLKIVPSPVRDPLEMMAPGADRNGQIATLFSVILMEMTRRFQKARKMISNCCSSTWRSLLPAWNTGGRGGGLDIAL